MHDAPVLLVAGITTLVGGTLAGCCRVVSSAARIKLAWRSRRQTQPALVVASASPVSRLMV